MPKVVLDVRKAALLLTVVAAGSLVATRILARGSTPQARPELAPQQQSAAPQQQSAPPQQPAPQQQPALQQQPNQPASPQMPTTPQESAASQEPPHTAAQAAQAAESMAHHHHGSGLAADPHIKLTALRLATVEDERRAAEIVRILRVAIEPYRDADRAQAEGYKPFLPQLVLPQYHFTNWWRGFLGGFAFDPAKPTSLLYRKRDGKYELTGAMYTAPDRATEEEMNARVPLSVAQWHAHVNICMPKPGEGQHADWTRFGFAGSITTREACDAAGGVFHPQIFGWMVHVHPFETDPAAVWTH